jgi:hypothetical protein
MVQTIQVISLVIILNLIINLILKIIIKNSNLNFIVHPIMSILHQNIFVITQDKIMKIKIVNRFEKINS